MTDPRGDALVVRARLQPLDGGHYRLWALYDPALDNGGMDDRATTAAGTLVATDGAVSSALVARPALRSTTSGLVGTPTDPGPTSATGTARPVPATSCRPPGCPTTPRWRSASAARSVGPPTRPGAIDRAFASTTTAYDRGWHGYVRSLKDVPASASGVESEYLASALVLAAAEDKRHRGAFVASPSAPWVWGDEVKDLSLALGAYHLVWSRDAYQFGTALWAMGDHAAARRIVRWLFGTQQLADGSFPQNSDVSGTPVWTSLQLDEVAFPIVLAHLVGKRDAATWRGVRKAHFLVTFRDEETGRRAPYTPQERWENQAGCSPASIAAEVAGLVCAADLARKHHRPALAKRWLRVADRWQQHVKGWTVTRNGPLDDGPYFLRLTKNGKPDTASPYGWATAARARSTSARWSTPASSTWSASGCCPPTTRPWSTPSGRRRPAGGRHPERAVLAALQPRRVRRDPHRRRVDHHRPGTHRTLGRGWPILTGERGEYAVTAGADASGYLEAMAAATGDSGMLAEQVWDGRPPTGAACCPAGGAPAPRPLLVWSHAQLVRLAWTIQRGRPVDQQAVVADRYLR